MEQVAKITEKLEYLNISKIDKFETDILETNRDTAPQKSWSCTDVCLVGVKIVPHSRHHTSPVKLRDSGELYLR